MCAKSLAVAWDKMCVCVCEINLHQSFYFHAKLSNLYQALEI